MEWWKKEFGQNYYELYKLDLDQKRTSLEVKFLISNTPIKKTDKILDLACGQGRHAIALSKKGYNNITGFDYSNELLAIAKEHDKKHQINFEQGDIRKLNLSSKYQFCYCLFTAFGYFKNEKDNFKTLKNISNTLDNNGYFLLDLLNPSNKIKSFNQNDKILKRKSTFEIQEKKFDCNEKINLNTMRWSNTITDYSNPNNIIFRSDVRLYTFDQIESYLNQVGLDIIKVWGNFKGEEYSSDSKRMILLTQKK